MAALHRPTLTVAPEPKTWATTDSYRTAPTTTSFTQTIKQLHFKHKKGEQMKNTNSQKDKTDQDKDKNK
jgi:hypothetical protein